MLLRILFGVFICTSAYAAGDKTSDDFYSDLSGTQIMNTENYPEEIHTFLSNENKFLFKYIKERHYTAVVEVGCADGSALTGITKEYIKYLGIDINEAQIEKAKAKYKDYEEEFRPEFATVSVYELHSVIAKQKKLQQVSVAAEKPLIVFPFNLFGNLKEHTTLLLNLFDLNFDVYISQYNQEHDTNEIRRKYYSNCRINPLVFEKYPTHSVFLSPCGFNSTAFEKQYFNNLVSKLLKNRFGISIEFDDFDRLGYASILKLTR